MTTDDCIRFLHAEAARFDIRREVHTRNNATMAAAIASVQARTAADLATELERLAAAANKPKEAHRD